VHDRRVGAAFRAVRIRRGWRQEDVARRANVSPSLISRIERGDIGRVSLDHLERVGSVLEMRVQVVARWRGGDLDRLVNARHAALLETVARELVALGWVFVPAVSFSLWGERGMIDILAWHPATRSLLVIELKTEIVDVEETLGTLDRKRRLAAEIASERGWRAANVSVWLAVAEGTANRSRVASFVTMLRAALPVGGVVVRRWLREPVGTVAALSFVRNSHPGTAKQSLSAGKRVRVPASRPIHARPTMETTAPPLPEPTPAT
jgi:transcriptional regulator with XRE-family HTH domain